MFNNIKMISNELWKKIIERQATISKEGSNINYSILYDRYLNKFSKSNGEKKIKEKPLTEQEIEQNYGISPQQFEQKCLPQMFRLGMVFIFEKRGKGIELVKEFRGEWKDKVKYYYMIIPETAKLGLEFNRIFKTFSNYVDVNKILPSVRNLMNALAKYEVLSKSKTETREPFSFDVNKIVFIEGDKQRKIAFGILLNPFSDALKKLGKLNSDYAKKQFKIIINNMAYIVSYFIDDVFQITIEEKNPPI